jgi:putative Mg2+ transporter-C (MgtC) family protein
VGYERAVTGKRAGLRTHMLVAVGSALYVSTCDLAVDWAKQATPVHAPSILQVQIAVLSPVQAIATGIGFLGAGTIFLGGHQQRVHGLTTAASIWVIAAIGIAVGCDRYVLATGASLITLIILHLLTRLEPHPAKPNEDPGTADQSAEASAGTKTE